MKQRHESKAGQYAARNKFIRGLAKKGLAKKQVLEQVKAKHFPSIGGVKFDSLWSQAKMLAHSAN